jgi:hypothetical protein
VNAKENDRSNAEFQEILALLRQLQLESSEHSAEKDSPPPCQCILDDADIPFLRIHEQCQQLLRAPNSFDVKVVSVSSN